MNNCEQINKHFLSISHLLENRQLKQALDELGTFVKDVPEWDLHNKFDEISTSFHYMLKYFRQGANDPQRGTLYSNLLRQTSVLNEKLAMAQYELVSSELFYITKREQKQNTKSLADYNLIFETFTEDSSMLYLLHQGDKLDEELKALRKRHEEAQKSLFCKVWTSEIWNTSIQEEAKQFLNSMLIPVNDIALLTSAVTMALLQVFDIRKLDFLLDAYNHPDPQVNQRALTGFVLTCMRYDKRLTLEPEMQARIKLMQENQDFVKDLFNLQIHLFRTRETKKAERKMRDEIIPEVIKSSRNLRNLKINFLEIDEENLLNDKNPEWKKWEENSELTNKIQELGNMQTEGVDVYMTTFSQLKSFPFFRDINNWFYPFDTQHSSVLQVFPNNEPNFVVRTILSSTYFCNSDKYSFCFIIQSVPAQQREMFSAQVANQNEMTQQETEKALSEDKSIREILSRQYVQDLYRFFKLHPRRHEFCDIFEKTDLNFQTYSTLSPFLADAVLRRKIAEYLFYKEYYAESMHMFQQLASEHQIDAELFQKLGFCYQKGKAYNKALEAYRQADILKSDTLWTIRHLAQCYRFLKEPEKALSYYLKALEIQPDNLNLLLHAGECEAETGNYENAFAHFFKVEYLSSQPERAWRSIAWCSFVTAKYEQAGKYYNLLLQKENPDVQDYLNAGHTEWVQGHTEQAVNLYLKGCLAKGNTEEFIELFNKDSEELVRQGIMPEDITLMADTLRYNEKN